MGLFDAYAYEAAKRALRDTLVPDLQSMKDELRGILCRDRGRDQRADSPYAELLAEIRRLHARISSLDKKIDMAVRFHERLARVEAKLGLSAP